MREHTAPESSRDGTALAPVMASIVAAARAAWPAIDLAAERFVRYLTDRIPQGAEIEVALRGIHTSDLYLACACVEGNAEALAAFERHCLAVIDRALPRLGLDADAVHEVKQRLRHALLVADSGPPRIAAFAGRGDLRSWVRVTAMRQALAIERHRRRLVADEDRLVELVASGESPELEYFKRMYRREVELALREAIQALSDRERALIKLHVLDRVTVQQIGRLYRVHRATAGRWLEDARARLLQATRAHLLARLNVQPAELDSILRLVSSRLEISLGPLLGRRRG
jgi:RNA polymerase sigma-70 factor (ECF subfamily)